MNKNFQSKWTLWKKDIYQKQRIQFDYMIGQESIFKVNDIQDLCRFSNSQYWNVLDYFYNSHIENSNILSCEFSLFKDNINPVWEDKKNMYGSSFSFYIQMVNNDLVQEIWENLICEFISDSFSFNRHINGIRAIDRTLTKGKIKFEVWLDLGSARFSKSLKTCKYEERVLRAVSQTIEDIFKKFLSNYQRPQIQFKEHLDKVFQLIYFFYKLIPLKEKLYIRGFFKVSIYLKKLKTQCIKKWGYTSHLERVILAQGPCQSSLYRSLFNKVGIPTNVMYLLILIKFFY